MAVKSCRICKCVFTFNQHREWDQRVHIFNLYWTLSIFHFRVRHVLTWRIHILIPYLPQSSINKSCHICTWPCKLLPQPAAQYFTKQLTVIWPYTSGIFSQFCVVLDMSLAKHTIPSTPAKTATKYSFFPRTIKDWNSLPDKIATIKEPKKL